MSDVEPGMDPHEAPYEGVGPEPRIRTARMRSVSPSPWQRFRAPVEGRQVLSYVDLLRETLPGGIRAHEPALVEFGPDRFHVPGHPHRHGPATDRVHLVGLRTVRHVALRVLSSSRCSRGGRGCRNPRHQDVRPGWGRSRENLEGAPAARPFVLVAYSANWTIRQRDL